LALEPIGECAPANLAGPGDAAHGRYGTPGRAGRQGQPRRLVTLVALVIEQRLC
jgi:hypothetical protein